MDQEIFTSYYPSPIGILKIKFSVDTIKKIKFIEQGINNDIECNGLKYSKEIRNTYNLIYDQLNEYFTGQRKKFQLPISIEGTEFQKKVWSYIEQIPYGEVKTYQEIAGEIGHKNSVRAVGNACGENPLLLVIPCHRIVRSDGTTGGYAGDNYRKQWLLQHEKKYEKEQNRFAEGKLIVNRQN